MIDADGLWHLINCPSIIHGYTKAVLTPNAMEFSRLMHTVLKTGPEPPPPTNAPSAETVGDVARALGGVTIVHKGVQDVVSNGTFTERVVDEGCPRR